MAEITELATDMRANGTMDQATFEKITMRRFEPVEATRFPPIAAEDIRALRERANMSQAVFARAKSGWMESLRDAYALVFALGFFWRKSATADVALSISI